MCVYTVSFISFFSVRGLAPTLTSQAKLGFGEVFGGRTTTGVGASLTVSSITAGVISFISTSLAEISGDATVSTAAELKEQEFVVMNQKKDTQMTIWIKPHVCRLSSSCFCWAAEGSEADVTLTLSTPGHLLGISICTSVEIVISPVFMAVVINIINTGEWRMKILAEMAELLKKRWNQLVRDDQKDKREPESGTVRN